MISPAGVLAGLGDAVIAIDRDAKVIVWNPTAERLLGHPAEQTIGNGLPDLGLPLEALMAGRERRLTLRARDGTVLPATVTATPLRGAEGDVEGLVLVVKDLRPWVGPAADPAAGETQAAEERLGAAFRGILEATATDPERGGRLESLAKRLAELGRRLLPGVSCLVAVVPAERQDLLHCLASAGELAESLVGQTFPREGSVMGDSLGRGEAVEDTEARPGRGPGAGGGHRARFVPMSVRQRLPDGRRALGAIAFYRAGPRPFAPAERRLLDDFGALAGMTLQRAEFRAATERSMARLQLAVDVALDLARSLDYGEVVRRLVRRAAVATRADRCALVRVEGGEEGELVTVDAYDVTGVRGALGYRRPVDRQVLLREAVVTRAPVLGGQHDLSMLPANLREAIGDIRRTAVVPLLHGGEVVALLVLSRRREQPFTSEEVDTLQLLGGPAALAIRNAYLYARTEEASRVKTDFLDMAAHELRTPLTVISGYLSILRDGAFGPYPPPWEDPLEILDRKAAELRRLVDDLLLAARLETGRLDPVLEPLDLREVASQAARAAGDVPELRLPPAPVMVRGDREQLARLVDHLVANALAYVREGQGPWARVEVEACPDQSEARLVVEDRGRGLAAGAEERIFERFSRIEDPHHPMVPGTGLGLYIARELAQRHGGRLEMEWSLPGAGSRFAVHLPLLGLPPPGPLPGRRDGA